MNCKTCNNPYENTAQYCSNCGAKIVDDRLSLKGTWEEFVGPFFSWDNNFWRTFFGLFTNPKDVLEAYISGARKKYFQPFSYIILYATVAVFFYKFFPMDIITESSEAFAEGFNSYKPEGKNTKIPKFDINSYMESFMSYYNFIIIALIPLYALTSYIVYIKKRHNFFEHLVFNSYLQANFGFCSLLLQLIFVNFMGLPFMSFSYLLFVLFIVFAIYAFKKLYKHNLKQSIFYGIKYILFFIILYLSVFILIGVIFTVVILITMLSKS